MSCAVAAKGFETVFTGWSADLQLCDHGPRSAAHGLHSHSVCVRRSAFTKNINAILLSDGNNGPKRSLHEATLSEFKEAYGKVMSCEEVKAMFSDHRQGSALA